MRKNLLIAGILIALASLAVGVIVIVPALQTDADQPKTVKPRPEVIAALPKTEEAKKPPPPVVKKRFTLTSAEPKKTTQVEPQPKKPIEEKKPPAKIEPEPKKAPAKPEPEKRPKAKVIEFDPVTALNDPDGTYTVKPLFRGKEIEIIGKVKTLKISELGERAVLDASKLEAEEIIFLGNINGESRVILGKTQMLTIRDVNDKSLLDGSACAARSIFVNGSVNGRSTVKLHAPKGTVEFLGTINDHAQIDIAAPQGKVLFKGRGDSVINGDANLTVLAKDVELRGAVNGNQTRITVTLTSGGSLKFRRLNGQAHLHYRKANGAEPAPRIDAGEIGRADFRMLPAAKQ